VSLDTGTWRDRVVLWEGAERRVRMVKSQVEGALHVGSAEQWDKARAQLAKAYREAADLLERPTGEPVFAELLAQDNALVAETRDVLGYARRTS
jgi:hypothetical protein